MKMNEPKIELVNFKIVRISQICSSRAVFSKAYSVSFLVVVFIYC